MKYTSQIISAGSGSVGGCKYSRNRYGPYITNRSVPVNPNTAQQQAMRGFFSGLVTRWTSTLTQAQRDAWDIYGFNTPTTDSLGLPINLTGQNWYIAMNSLRQQGGSTIIDVAPAVFAGAPLTPPTMTAAVSATDLITVAFTNSDPWAIAVGGKLMIFVGRPQNPSVLSFKGPYRFAGAVVGAVVPPTSPAVIASSFPFTVGQRVHMKTRAYMADARISGVYRASMIAS